MGHKGASDPVDYRIGGDRGQNEWGFWDETWTVWNGPYPTENSAREALRKYVRELDRENSVKEQEKFEQRHMRRIAVALVTMFVVLLELGILRFMIPVLINMHTDVGLVGVVVLAMFAIAFPWIFYVKILRPVLKAEEE